MAFSQVPGIEPDTGSDLFMKRTLFSLLFVGVLIANTIPVSAQPHFSEPYDDHAFDRPPAPPPAPGVVVVESRPVVAVYYGPFEYLTDRFLDLCDVARIKVGAGGFGVNARATTLVQLGAVFTQGTYVGWERRSIGVWQEDRFAGGFSAAYQTTITTTFMQGNEFADPTSDWNRLFLDRGYVRNGTNLFDDGRNRPLSVAAEVHLGIGVDVAVYPEELIDFVLGIFTVDILADDLVNIPY